MTNLEIDNYQLVFHYIPLAYTDKVTRGHEMKPIYLKSVSACLLAGTGRNLYATLKL